MELVGTESTDILLGEDGQPVASEQGDFSTVSDVECWLQDIKNEALTEEGELFYEDDVEEEAYGFSIKEFIQAEYDEFVEQEIQQRIKEKLEKREDVDEGSIKIAVSYDGRSYHIKVVFQMNNAEEEYNLEIDTDGVEVILSD